MKQEDLIKGEWYHGEGRFIGGIALWNGQHFIGFQQKFGDYFSTLADYGDHGFTPLEHIPRHEVNR